MGILLILDSILSYSQCCLSYVRHLLPTMIDDRSRIPADIRRRVLIEAGHRCAIPTCRYIEVEVHHIEPWSQCQTHDYDNLISLCPNCHRRADRGEIDRKSLRLYKSNLRFTHDKFSQIEVDLLFELARISNNMGLIWPTHSLLLLKRLLDVEYVIQKKSPAHMVISGIDLTPHLIKLTEKGRSFIKDMGLHEL